MIDTSKKESLKKRNFVITSLTAEEINDEEIVLFCLKSGNDVQGIEELPDKFYKNTDFYLKALKSGNDIYFPNNWNWNLAFFFDEETVENDLDFVKELERKCKNGIANYKRMVTELEFDENNIDEYFDKVDKIYSDNLPGSDYAYHISFFSEHGEFKAMRDNFDISVFKNSTNYFQDKIGHEWFLSNVLSKYVETLSFDKLELVFDLTLFQEMHQFENSYRGYGLLYSMVKKLSDYLDSGAKMEEYLLEKIIDYSGGGMLNSESEKDEEEIVSNLKKHIANEK
tara:strand:- start:316 stop:1164 length:849 start_codon:yes stop_codon:yes gene_type:complete